MEGRSPRRALARRARAQRRRATPRSDPTRAPGPRLDHQATQGADRELSPRHEERARGATRGGGRASPPTRATRRQTRRASARTREPCRRSTLLRAAWRNTPKKPNPTPSLSKNTTTTTIIIRDADRRDRRRRSPRAPRRRRRRSASPPAETGGGKRVDRTDGRFSPASRWRRPERPREDRGSARDSASRYAPRRSP